MPTVPPDAQYGPLVSVPRSHGFPQPANQHFFSSLPGNQVANIGYSAAHQSYFAERDCRARYAYNWTAESVEIVAQAVFENSKPKGGPIIVSLFLYFVNLHLIN
jgi:hypothetical protein